MCFRGAYETRWDFAAGIGFHQNGLRLPVFLVNLRKMAHHKGSFSDFDRYCGKNDLLRL
jgi:hypothetical protein